MNCKSELNPVVLSLIHKRCRGKHPLLIICDIYENLVLNVLTPNEEIWLDCFLSQLFCFARSRCIRAFWS